MEDIHFLQLSINLLNIFIVFDELSDNRPIGQCKQFRILNGMG